MGAPLMVLGEGLEIRGTRGWRRWMIGLSLGLSLGVIGAWTAPYWGSTAPPEAVRRALESDGASGFWVYDRSGLLLRAIPERGDHQEHQTGQEIQESRGRWVALGEMSPWVGEAVVCLEDRGFWSHRGVPWRGVARAVWVNLRRGRLSVGGSGLTQQLVKLHHRRARGLKEKLSEARWAWWVNQRYSKSEQLERYLNAAPFGNQLRGVWAASRFYFGVEPSQLSLAQASYLAALPHAPDRLNPLRDAGRAVPRQQVALKCLLERGLIDERVYRVALEERIAPSRHAYPFYAPHLVDRVAHERSRSISSETSNRSEGSEESERVEESDRLKSIERLWKPDGPERWEKMKFEQLRLPFEPGFSSHGRVLTLELEVQLSAEQIVRRYAELNRTRGLRRVAAVALDVERGEVVFWVGSADYRSPDAGQVDHVSALRQPGSTLKPFLYALALERGFKLDQQLPDRRAYFKTAAGHYRPTNYNHRTRGEVSLMSALAQSLNIPSVWLLNQVGVDALLETLRGAGLESLDQDARHYGLGLSLGDGDVSLIDLVNAYRGLMLGGLYTPWHATFKRKWELTMLYEEPRRFLSEEKSYAVIQALSSAKLREPSFGALSPLRRPYPSFAKTGTSQGYTNAWTIGGTPRYIVGVWVLPERGAQLSGGVIAAPLWAELMDLLHEGRAPLPLPWAELDPEDRRALSGVVSAARHPDDRRAFERLEPSPEPPPDPKRSARARLTREGCDLTRDTQDRSRFGEPGESPRDGGALLEIVSPPHLSRYHRVPRAPRASDSESSDDEIQAWARASYPCTRALIRGELTLTWTLNGREVESKGLTAWIKPWRGDRERHNLCVHLARVEGGRDGESRDREVHDREASDEVKRCVSILTPR